MGLFTTFLYYALQACGICSDVPVSFSILVICLFEGGGEPGVWLEAYWFYWPFQRTRFFFFLYWFPVFNFINFYSNSYSFLLILDLTCSSFSSFLRQTLSWLILNPSSFLICIFNAINFPQGLFSLYPTNFDKVCFCFYIIQNIFKFILLFLLWLMCYWSPLIWGFSSYRSVIDF